MDKDIVYPDDPQVCFLFPSKDTSSICVFHHHFKGSGAGTKVRVPLLNCSLKSQLLLAANCSE